jgi:hypothetical protein
MAFFLIYPHNFSILLRILTMIFKNGCYKIEINWSKKLQICRVEFLSDLVWEMLGAGDKEETS